MNADYVISVNRHRKLVNVRLSGFFSVEDVWRYAAAVREALGQLGGPTEQHRMLCDITQMQIQPQEVVAAFGAFLAEESHTNRKMAFVLADASLARMQVNRAKADRRARNFHTMREAEAWLFAEDRAAA